MIYDKNDADFEDKVKQVSCEGKGLFLVLLNKNELVFLKVWYSEIVAWQDRVTEFFFITLRGIIF